MKNILRRKLFSSKKISIILIAGAFFLAIGIIYAATNIDSINSFTWNDFIGWFDFYITNSVQVTSSKIQGFASSSAGAISLDCATSPKGDICATQSNYFVANDNCGNLSGWGWNDTYGWISFCGGYPTSTGCTSNPSGVQYRVQIDPNTGDFFGWAWNDVAGWISFCSTAGESAPAGQCLSSAIPYKVNTTWRATIATGTLDSTIFDTGASSTQYNSIVWNGDLPVATTSCAGGSGPQVKFQLVAADSTSSLTTFTGPDGTTGTYYPSSGGATPGTTNPLGYHHKGRYFKYRILLQTDSARTVSPRIDDIIVNWSP